MRPYKPKPPVTGMTAAIRALKVGENMILLGTQHRVNQLAKQMGQRIGRTYTIRTISATAVRIWRLS